MDAELLEKMGAVEERHWWFRAKREIITTLLWRYLSLHGKPHPGRPREPRSKTRADCGVSASTAHARRPRVADLGCGCGALLTRLAADFDAVGMDSSAVAVEFSSRTGAKVVAGRLPDEVPLESGSFDAVVLADVLEHIEDDRAALAAAGELLRTGGVTVVTVPAQPRLWSGWDEAHGHRRRYTQRSLAALFEGAGLEAELVSYFNTLLFPAAAAARLLEIRGLRRRTADLEVPPGAINEILYRIFAAERHLLGRVRLPVGLSLAAVLKRKP